MSLKWSLQGQQGCSISWRLTACCQKGRCVELIIDLHHFSTPVPACVMC